MKEKILQLRNEGKSYKEIREILKCSKSTISYHCGDGQKEKTKERLKLRRENILLEKEAVFYRSGKEFNIKYINAYNSNLIFSINKKT